MCIIILNKKDSILSNDTLKNSFNNNKDGAGFAYIDANNKLIIKKGIFDLNTFLNTYKSIKKQNISDIIIHCRISTGGNIDLKNCHPHKINNELVLAHNGILNINMPKDSKVSDTILFIKKYLKTLTTQNLKDKYYKQMLADFIGQGNKFVIMNNHGETFIINKHLGHTDKAGNWYSNDSYQYNITYYNKYDLYEQLYSKPKPKSIITEAGLISFENTLKTFTPFDFDELGKYPLVDASTGVLYPETETVLQNKDLNLYYLDDLSEDLYELYLYYYDTSISNLTIYDNNYSDAYLTRE